MKRILSVFLLAILIMTANAQTSVVPYLSKDVMPEGMIYYLPKRDLKVKATAKCTISKPGPFFRYAERFFAQNDVVIEESTVWKLADVKLFFYAEPNHKAAFEVKPALKGVSNFINLSNTDGIIKGVNLPVESPKSYSRKNKVDKDKRPSVKFDMNVLGEEALVANSIPKMAELAAKQVYRIRESRMAILNGEVDVMPTGDAMKAVLKKMDKMEKELLALFFGKSVSYTETKEYVYTPEDDVKKHVIFRISAVEGLLAADNIMGDPVYMDIKGTYPLAPLPPKKAPKILGFAYAVPGSANIEIYDNENLLVQKTFVMPQFGYTLHLNPKLTDNLDVSIKYNVSTGEIISVTNK